MALELTGLARLRPRRGWGPVGCGIGALFALVAFVHAAWGDHTATASAAAALCLALAVLGALDLESFEGLGIKAKLRATLTDAEARIAGLDGIISALARMAFVQVVRAGMVEAERRDLVAELSTALRAAGRDDEAINALKRPVYAFLAGRLWYTFGSVRANYLSEQIKNLEARERAIPIGPEENERQRAALRARRQAMMAGTPENVDSTNFDQFRRIAVSAAQTTPTASDEHRRELTAIAEELATIYEESVRSGNFTDRALEAMGNSGDLQSAFVAARLPRLRTAPDPSAP